MIMNGLLIDYSKSQLSDSNCKPEYKEVTNASFAKFIVDVADKKSFRRQTQNVCLSFYLCSR